MRGIIIGAGIGGLATAIGLQKQGFEITVHEAAPTIKPVGAGLWVAPNGLNVLKRIEPGLYDQVKAGGRHFDQIRILHHDGQVFSSVDTRSLAEKFGTQPVAILRSELHACLCKYLQPDSLFTAQAFVGYEETAQGVRVHFGDGSRAEADFLIGADGIHSKVRDQLFGPQALRYSGQTCWRGISPYTLPEPYTHTASEIWCDEPGVRAGFSHVTPELTYFYLTDAVPAGGQDKPEQVRDFLLKRFGHFPAVVKGMISAIDPNHILRNDLYDLSPIRHYTRGRIALLGDAAHATTPNLGQGANQALESALTLTRQLAHIKSPDEIPTAFASYEQKRHRKATYIVNTSHQIAELSNIKSRFGQKIRNFVMSHMPEALTEKTFEKMYALED